MDIRGDDLQRVIDDQAGLFTQSQVTVCGYSRSRVRRHIESGRWVIVLRGVYAVAAGPLDREQTLRAALLYGGAHALLSHHTAAEEWGFVRRATSLQPVHVTVPYGRSARCQAPTSVRGRSTNTAPVARVGSTVHPGVVVHRSRAYPYVVHGSALPRTGAADTAVDLATAEPTAREAMSTLVSVVSTGVVTVGAVRTRLVQRRPYRYRAALNRAVEFLTDGVASVLELAYAVEVEEAHGLPRARRQSPVTVDGRTLFEDVDYSPHGADLIVRLDGRRFHSTSAVAFRDRRRDNAAELAGRPRLVYGYDEVVRDPCGVAAEVATVLRREGWVGESGCARCAPFAHP
ncbi:type IV toxin-antitoxin system AbiEi family antitoxin domain-containing protein [Rhodococcoides kroppenstedtii]|uniref:type IV toxin-antitoxin system AbiEi family antitoxin domain-containing protein n=1 Tax=Rhodococcoides kroppenstedtii TaxID=293050 RepID=UPI0028ECFB30|nr:type IV toxin-antitoxin system AbiEi family antitoxin domain-containing protein [Rhodococcus kroppenstedtii]